jgi:hypothetical protein
VLIDQVHFFSMLSSLPVQVLDQNRHVTENRGIYTCGHEHHDHDKCSFAIVLWLNVISYQHLGRLVDSAHVLTLEIQVLPPRRPVLNQNPDTANPMDE